jgi:hypothetical protein
MYCDSIVSVIEPLTPDAATATIHRIIRDGQIAWSKHALAELAADNLTTVDAVNVMRAGAVMQAADLERGSWRYRMETRRICVVVAFRGDAELVVVTAWRKK